MARSEAPGLHDGDGQAGAVLLARVLGHDLGRHPIMPHQLSLHKSTSVSAKDESNWQICIVVVMTCLLQFQQRSKTVLQAACQCE